MSPEIPTSAFSSRQAKDRWLAEQPEKPRPPAYDDLIVEAEAWLRDNPKPEPKTPVEHWRHQHDGVLEAWQELAYLTLAYFFCMGERWSRLKSGWTGPDRGYAPWGGEAVAEHREAARAAAEQAKREDEARARLAAEMAKPKPIPLGYEILAWPLSDVLDSKLADAWTNDHGDIQWSWFDSTFGYKVIADCDPDLPLPQSERWTFLPHDTLLPPGTLAQRPTSFDLGQVRNWWRENLPDTGAITDFAPVWTQDAEDCLQAGAKYLRVAHEGSVHAWVQRNRAYDCLEKLVRVHRQPPDRAAERACEVLYRETSKRTGRNASREELQATGRVFMFAEEKQREPLSGSTEWLELALVAATRGGKYPPGPLDAEAVKSPPGDPLVEPVAKVLEGRSEITVKQLFSALRERGLNVDYDHPDHQKAVKRAIEAARWTKVRRTSSLDGKPERVWVAHV